MNRLLIDLDFAIRGLIYIVEQFGYDHHAPADPNGQSCVYGYFTNNGTVLSPVCIVGQFMHNLGLLRMTLEDPYAHYTDEDPRFTGACELDSILWTNLENAGVEITEEAKRFLRYAQVQQDESESWGFAVRHAMEAIREEALAAHPTNLYIGRLAGSTPAEDTF